MRVIVQYFGIQNFPESKVDYITTKSQNNF